MSRTAIAPSTARCRRLLPLLLAATVCSGVLTVRPAAGAPAPAKATRALDLSLGDTPSLADVDTRVGSVAPSNAQLAEATSLGTVRWNRYGTPESLINYGGYLA